MQAKDLTMTDLLSFQAEHGKIFFNGERTIFLLADAVGMLRKDLISALGIDYAKGFLLRHGWNCGTHDARILKEMFAWETDLEWLHAGIRMKGLMGMAHTVPIRIQADRKTGEFSLEGFWHDSHEAEQHIRHFGRYYEPVCFSLVGYAGGYCSEYMGKKIIFKEIACLGKGDARCHWIGKPVEDWGEDIQDILPFYEEENLSIELDRAYRRIEKQKEVLNHALEINGKLSKMLAQGGSLSAIVQVLAQSHGLTVVLNDKNMNVMEAHGHYAPHDLLPYFQYPEKKYVKLVHRLTEEKRTVLLHVPERYGWQHERLISPILLKNEIYGYLSFIKTQGSFDELETISLERASTICAIYLLSERNMLEAEQRIRGEFLNELLMGNRNAEDLTYRMKLMGYDLIKPHYVLVFSLQQKEASHAKYREAYYSELRNKFSEALHTQLKAYGKGCLVSGRVDDVIALIPYETLQQMKLGPKGFGELLVHVLEAQFAGFNITLGISSLCQGIEKLRKGFREANQSIWFGNAGSLRHKVVTYDELGAIRLLLNSKHPEEVEEFADSLLGHLAQYDQEHRAELLKTLYYFLQNQGNIQETARFMTISIGAIRYRLKRIQEIAGIDISHPKDFFDTHLALQIYLFFGKLSL